MVTKNKPKANIPKAQARLLRQKIRSKRKQPRFKRQELWAQATLKDTWRRPKGRHSKMRVEERGRGRIPKPGYGSPAAVKGLTRHGFIEVRVSNIRGLEGISPQTHAAVIASTVGRKKRLEILKKAQELGITVSNA